MQIIDHLLGHKIRVFYRQYPLIEIRGAAKTGNGQSVGESEQVKQGLGCGIVRAKEFCRQAVLGGQLEVQIPIELIFPELGDPTTGALQVPSSGTQLPGADGITN